MVKRLVLFAICVACGTGLPTWQDGNGYRSSNSGGLYNFSSLQNMHSLQGGFGGGNNNFARPSPHYNQTQNVGNYGGYGSSGSNYNQGGGYNASRGSWQQAPGPGQGSGSFPGFSTGGGYGSPPQNAAHNSGQHGLWNASSQWSRDGAAQANGYGAAADYNSNQRQWHGGNRGFWNSSNPQRSGYNSNERVGLGPSQGVGNAANPAGYGNVNGGFGGNRNTMGQDTMRGQTGTNYGQWNSTNYRGNNFGGSFAGSHDASYGANVNSRNSSGFGRGSYNSLPGGYAPPVGNPYANNPNSWNNRNSSSPFDVRFGASQGSQNQSYPIIY